MPDERILARRRRPTLTVRTARDVLIGSLESLDAILQQRLSFFRYQSPVRFSWRAAQRIH